MTKIISNRAQCKNCKDIIESAHQWDWVPCSCFKNDLDSPGIFVDGGLAYIRRGGNKANIIELSETEEDKDNE